MSLKGMARVQRCEVETRQKLRVRARWELGPQDLAVLGKA